MRIFDDDYRMKVKKDNPGYNISDVTLLKIIGDERRLFYVALSRAKDDLFILTKETKESRFLLGNTGIIATTERLNWDDYLSKQSSQNRIIIEVKNNYNQNTTYGIKDRLKQEGYRFDPYKKSWYKAVKASETGIDRILSEDWIKSAHHVFIEIKDNKEYLIGEYIIIKGEVTLLRTGRGRRNN